MSRLWTRSKWYVLAAAGIAVNLLAMVVVFELVPEDGNIPPGIVVMAFWAVQHAALPGFVSLAVDLHVEIQRAEGGDVWPAVMRALKGHRPGLYAVVSLVLMAFTVFAVAAPRAWFEMPWLSATRYILVIAGIGVLWGLGGRGFDRRPAAPKPEFASPAERRRHLWQQVWPYALLAAMVAALVLGVVLILRLVPVVGVGGQPVVAASALWTVVWGVAFWFVIAWLEKGSAGPKPRFQTAAERRRHRWQRSWPYGSLAAVVAGYVLGIALIVWLSSVTGVGETPLAIGLLAWTVGSGVVLHLLIVWLETDPAPRPDTALTGAREAPTGTGPEPAGGGVLTWDDGARRREVKTSEQLREQVLRLHLSTVDLPRFADFVPWVGVPVSISLGDEESLLVTRSACWNAPSTGCCARRRTRARSAAMCGCPRWWRCSARCARAR